MHHPYPLFLLLLLVISSFALSALDLQIASFNYTNYNGCGGGSNDFDIVYKGNSVFAFNGQYTAYYMLSEVCANPFDENITYLVTVYDFSVVSSNSVSRTVLYDGPTNVTHVSMVFATTQCMATAVSFPLETSIFVKCDFIPQSNRTTSSNTIEGNWKLISDYNYYGMLEYINFNLYAVSTAPYLPYFIIFHDFDVNNMTHFEIDAPIVDVVVTGNAVYILQEDGAVCQYNVLPDITLCLTADEVNFNITDISSQRLYVSPSRAKLFWINERTAQVVVIHIPEMQVFSSVTIPPYARWQPTPYTFFQGTSYKGDILFGNFQIYDLSVPDQIFFIQDFPRPNGLLYACLSMGNLNNILASYMTQEDEIVIFQYQITSTLTPTKLQFQGPPSIVSNILADPHDGRLWICTSVPGSGTFLIYYYLDNSDSLGTAISTCENCTYTIALYSSAYTQYFSVVEYATNSTTLSVYTLNYEDHYIYATTVISMALSDSYEGSTIYQDTDNWLLVLYNCAGGEFHIDVYNLTYTIYPVLPAPSANFSLPNTEVPCVLPNHFCSTTALIQPAWNGYTIVVAAKDYIQVYQSYEAIIYTLLYNIGGITIASNSSVSVYERVNFQSQVFGDELWLCVITPDAYAVNAMRVYPNNVCQVSLNIWDSIDSVSWWVSPKNNRVAFHINNFIIMENIATCNSSQNTYVGNLFTNMYYYSEFDQGVPSVLYEKGSTSIIVLVPPGGNWKAIADCPAGMFANSDGFCSLCSPGTVGYGCDECTAGFVCDAFGLGVPNAMCPAGHYCAAGTTTADRFSNDTHAPIICPAGTYCPPGIAPPGYNGGPLSCVPGYYCEEGSQTIGDQCPNNTFSVSGAESVLDCLCNKGYYGFQGKCVLCPATCNCYENVLSNCWLAPNVSLQDFDLGKAVPTQCVQYKANGANPCNPTQLSWDTGTGSDFPCQPGYTDRLCARCESEYFASGRECSPCKGMFKFVLPIGYGIALLVVSIYAWKVSPGNSAVIKIVVFHYQSLMVVVMGGVEWEGATSKFFTSSSHGSSFAIYAIECVFPWWSVARDGLIFMLLLPFFFILLGAAAGLGSYLSHKYYKMRSDQLQAKCVKFVAIFISLIYFNIAISVFNIFGCTSTDAFSEQRYLSAYPYVACPSKQWYSYVVIAAIGFCLEVVAFPLVLFLFMKIRRHDLLHDENLKEIFSSFYSVYTPDHYYWEMLVILRRLLIAFLASFVPFNSPLLLAGFVLVLLTYTILQIRRKPFVRPIDNLLDHTSHLILLLTVVGGLLITLPLFSHQAILISMALFAANAAFGVVSLVCIVMRYYKQFAVVTLAGVKGLTRSMTMKRGEDENEYLLPAENVINYNSSI